MQCHLCVEFAATLQAEPQLFHRALRTSRGVIAGCVSLAQNASFQPINRSDRVILAMLLDAYVASSSCRHAWISASSKCLLQLNQALGVCAVDDIMKSVKSMTFLEVSYTMPHIHVDNNGATCMRSKIIVVRHLYNWVATLLVYCQYTCAMPHPQPFTFSYCLPLADCHCCSVFTAFST